MVVVGQQGFRERADFREGRQVGAVEAGVAGSVRVDGVHDFGTPLFVAPVDDDVVAARAQTESELAAEAGGGAGDEGDLLAGSGGRLGEQPGGVGGEGGQEGGGGEGEAGEGRGIHGCAGPHLRGTEDGWPYNLTRGPQASRPDAVPARPNGVRHTVPRRTCPCAGSA